MRKKERMTIGVAVIAGLVLSGCGSTSVLSDEEFSDAALSTCSALKESIDTAMSEAPSFEQLAEYYDTAAQELDALNFTEESAPNGALLQTSLAGLADSYSLFEVAVKDAVRRAGIPGSYSLLVTESGGVMVLPGGSIFDAEKLDVDPSAWVPVQTNLTQVSDAAQVLGLSDCSPNDEA